MRKKSKNNNKLETYKMENQKHERGYKPASFIIKFRLPIVIFVILATVFLGYKAKDITIEADITSSLPDSDPAAKLLKDVGEKYGGNASVMVILETDNVYTPQVLEDVQKVTDSIATMTGISYVTSLTNIIDIKSSDWGLEIGKLVDPFELPTADSEFVALRDRIFEKEMYKGILVSEDSTATIVVATISEDYDPDSLTIEIKKKVGQIELNEKVSYSGVPSMLNDVKEIIKSDLRFLLPITTLIIIIILFLGFRSWRGVIMPLLTVVVSVVWTVGLMSWLGYDLTVISDTIPIILLALGSAYTIHVLNRINETTGEDRKKALVLALAYIMIPVFLAFITTAFGFMSFIFGSYLTMIKDFGIFTALGITIAFVLSITFTPAMIALTGMYKKSNKNTEVKKSKVISSMLTRLAKRVMEHPKRIVVFWVGISVIFSIGAFRITRKVDLISYFKETSTTWITQHLVDEKLGGASPFYLVFDGDVQDPDFLKYMKDFEDFLRDNNENVKYELSVADLVAQMNDAMNEGEKIPDDRMKIEQLWMLIEGEDVMPQLIDDSCMCQAVIQGRFSSLESEATYKVERQFNEYLSSHPLPESLTEVRFTGMPPIYNTIDKSLISSQLNSLVLAIFLMLLMVSLTLWSVKDGVLSIIPLLLTITISFGFMGFSGIPLDIATVLVASVTLGVGIDYAVHIISHYRSYMKELNNVHDAVIKAITVSGNAIFINLLSVSLGFLVFLLSSLVPLNNFGLMMAMSMLISGFSAVTLLPSLIILFNKKKENKNKK